MMLRVSPPAPGQTQIFSALDLCSEFMTGEAHSPIPEYCIRHGGGQHYFGISGRGLGWQEPLRSARRRFRKVLRGEVAAER